MFTILTYIPYLICGFGVLVLVFSPRILKNWSRFKRESIVVEGTIIAVKEAVEIPDKSVNREPGMYWPIVRFSDGKGGLIESPKGYGISNHDWWKVGQTIPIRLLPGEPATARLDSPLQTNLELIVVVVFGVGFTLAGGAFIVLELLGVLS
jgi:hypothetical protein